MKEYNFPLTGIYSGLNPAETAELRDPGVEICHNLEPRENDYRLHQSVTGVTPTGAGSWTMSDSSWPHMRFHFLDSMTLGVGISGADLAVFPLLRDVAGAWTASAGTSLGALAEVESINMAGAGTYALIAVRLLAGTEALIVRDAVTGTFASAGVGIPTGRAVCFYRGQALVGTETWVYWGGIRNMEFDQTVDMNAGSLRLPDSEQGDGEILRLMVLGSGVRAYCTHGIFSLAPYTVDAASGFGEQGKIGLGILNPHAVDGDDSVHGMVDQDMNFWSISSEGAKRLGYRKYLSQLDREKLSVTYVPERRQFFISDGLLGFVLGEYGMYSTHQKTAGLAEFDGQLEGLVLSGSNTDLEFQTESFDLGQQSQKSLEAWECGAVYETDTDLRLIGQALTSYSYRDGFVELPGAYLNDRGIFTRKVTGRAFKLRLFAEFDPSGLFRLGKMSAQVKFVDNRNVRGVINVS